MTALRQEDDAPRGFVTMREYLRLQRRCEELEAIVAVQRGDERTDAECDLEHKVRLLTSMSPQGAKALITIARARRQQVVCHVSDNRIREEPPR